MFKGTESILFLFFSLLENKLSLSNYESGFEAGNQLTRYCNYALLPEGLVTTARNALELVELVMVPDTTGSH